MSIRLSEKHGVNPTMGVCFWCGEEDGTIALLGRLPNDREAGRHMVLNYDPCDSCAGQWERGIALFEVTTHANHENQVAINATRRDRDPLDGIFPTGRWCVMKEEAFTRIFHGDEVDATLKVRKAYIDADVYEHLGLARNVDDDGEGAEA